MSQTYDCRVPAERADGLAAAVAAIRRGEIVVVPTDTVYGLAADAFSPTAVGLLRSARGQWDQVPLPVLVSSWRMLAGIAEDLPAAGRALGDAFWPGPLTLLTRHARSLAWQIGDTSGVVAVRVPLHPLALDLIEQTGPLVLTGACRAGMPPVLSCVAAAAALGETVAVYLDGGRVAGGAASTVVDVSGPAPRAVRLAALSLEQLREVLPGLAGPEGDPAAGDAADRDAAVEGADTGGAASPSSTTAAR